MSDVLISSRFAASADALPKELRAKLPKLLKLLSSNPKNPGLSLKKMKAARPGIYEARLNRSFRVILEIGNGAIRLLDIGPHDVALRIGERVEESPTEYACHEDRASYESSSTLSRVELDRYLSGDDSALSFNPASAFLFGDQE